MFQVDLLQRKGIQVGRGLYGDQSRGHEEGCF